MRKLASLLILLCLLLCSCAQPAESEPEPEVLPVPVMTEEPQIQLDLVPEVLPEPTVYWPPGMAVTVDGVTLESSGSIYVDGVLCVKLEELAQALHTQWTWLEAEGGILWRGQWVELRCDLAGFRYGGNWVELPVSPLWYEDAVYVPVNELSQGLELAVLRDREQMHLYVGSAAGVWEIPTGYRVPVIMYHGVSDDLWGMTDLFARPADLEAQLQYLQENGFTTIWFEDLARIDQIEKPVMLTFDDGYLDNYTDLFPLLQKYQAKATIFVVTGTMDYNPRNLTSAQIRELSDSGLVSIQSHTVTHPYLASQTAEEQRWELEQSRLVLTRLTGRIPYVICYPSGNYNETTLELSRELYRMGIDMNGGDYWTGSDPYQVTRWYIARSHPIEAFVDMVE